MLKEIRGRQQIGSFICVRLMSGLNSYHGCSEVMMDFGWLCFATILSFFRSLTLQCQAIPDKTDARDSHNTVEKCSNVFYRLCQFGAEL